MDIPKVNIFGVAVSKWDMGQTVHYLTKAICDRKPHQVVTVNPIMIMAALDNPEYLAMLQRAEFIIPDGAGVEWAARYVGNPVAERIAGIDLLHRLLAEGERHGWKVFLLGASPEVIAAAAEKLHRQYPGITMAGFRDGYFQASEDREILQEIVRANPDILLVGRSADKQEPWIDRYKHKLNVPVMIGVGGSFDVISGKLKRAPKLFRRLHLEWFYRLMQEPWRYKRMLALPKFVLKIIREKENVQKP